VLIGRNSDLKWGFSMDYRPTDLDLDILHVVWVHKRCTVRQVVDGLKPGRDLALTTVTTLLNRMVDKGWLKRTKKGRGHFIYVPVISEERTKKTLLRDLINRLFKGSAPNLIQNAINSGDLDQKELDEISCLIDRAKRDRK
jgi:BlaI family penicillinase repressor